MEWIKKTFIWDIFLNEKYKWLISKKISCSSTITELCFGGRGGTTQGIFLKIGEIPVDISSSGYVCVLVERPGEGYY